MKLSAQPRTATAHSSRSFVFTFSPQLWHDSVSSEGTLSPSVGAGLSSASVGLGSSLCFCLTTLVRAPLRLCRMLSSTLGRGRGGSTPASANQPCEASTHASTSAREGQPRRWSGERARMGRGARVEARRRLTFEDVELRTLADSRELGLRGGDALGQLFCDGSGRSAWATAYMYMCVQLAPLVGVGQRTDEVVRRARALPVLLLATRVIVLHRPDHYRLRHRLRHRLHHGASCRPSRQRQR